MSSKQFAKVSVGVLEDPRFALLDPEHWRLALECYIVAAKERNDVLPGVEQLAFRLRRSEERVVRLLDDMPELFTSLGDGQYAVAFFSEWQATGKGATRERKEPTAHQKAARELYDHFARLAGNEALAPQSLTGDGTVRSRWWSPVCKWLRLVKKGGDYDVPRVKLAMEYAVNRMATEKLDWSTPASLDHFVTVHFTNNISPEKTREQTLNKVFFG